MNGKIVGMLMTRLATAVLTLLFIAAVVFTITSLLPGDVAQQILGQSATPEAVAGLRLKLGLDQPPSTRFLLWLDGIAHGDLGHSLVNGLPVSELVGGRIGNSLILAAVTAFVSVPIALLLGISAAMRPGSLMDRIVGTSVVFVVSVPEFLIATLAVLIFAVKLRWLPALAQAPRFHDIGDLARSFAMPIITLACVIVAQMTRMTRAAVMDALNAPYVETARLKGAGPIRIVLMHALPNAVGPIANAVALSLSYLLGGVIIVETIFNYPGIAKLMVDGVSTRDLPVVQACALIFCAGYLLLVMMADIAAILSSPRLRHQ
jgi:peptide/nickel transport system permease protein